MAPASKPKTVGDRFIVERSQLEVEATCRNRFCNLVIKKESLRVCQFTNKPETGSSKKCFHYQCFFAKGGNTKKIEIDLLEGFGSLEDTDQVALRVASLGADEIELNDSQTVDDAHAAQVRRKVGLDAVTFQTEMRKKALLSKRRTPQLNVTSTPTAEKDVKGREVVFPVPGADSQATDPRRGATRRHTPYALYKRARLAASETLRLAGSAGTSAIRDGWSLLTPEEKEKYEDQAKIANRSFAAKQQKEELLEAARCQEEAVKSNPAAPQVTTKKRPSVAGQRKKLQTKKARK